MKIRHVLLSLLLTSYSHALLSVTIEQSEWYEPIKTSDIAKINELLAKGGNIDINQKFSDGESCKSTPLGLAIQELVSDDRAKADKAYGVFRKILEKTPIKDTNDYPYWCVIWSATQALDVVAVQRILDPLLVYWNEFGDNSGIKDAILSRMLLLVLLGAFSQENNINRAVILVEYLLGSGAPVNNIVVTEGTVLDKLNEVESWSGAPDLSEIRKVLIGAGAKTFEELSPEAQKAAKEKSDKLKRIIFNAIIDGASGLAIAALIKSGYDRFVR